MFNNQSRRLCVRQHSMVPILSVQELCPQKDVLSGIVSFILLPSTRVSNASAGFLPPNILVKMMMSDRDFYISPQLASHPCSPSTFAAGEGLTHAHQSLTSPFPLPLPAPQPPSLASRHAGLLPPVSQPATIILNVLLFFLFFNLFQLATKTRHIKNKTHHMPESKQHVSILENRFIQLIRR